MAAVLVMLALAAPEQMLQVPAVHLDASSFSSQPYLVDLPETWAYWPTQPNAATPPEALTQARRSSALSRSGAGWLGLDIVMPKDGPTTLGLWLFHLGDVEVFWDGGHVGGRTREAVPSAELRSPQPIVLSSPPGRHRLRVFLHNPWAASLSKISGVNGVRAKIGDPELASNPHLEALLGHSELHGLFSGLALTLALLHGLLFLSRPNRRDNLNLALAVTTAGALMWVGHRAVSSQTVADFFAYRVVVAWLILGTVTALAAFFCSVSKMGLPRWFPFFVASGVVATFMAPWTGVGPLLLFTYLGLGLILRALFLAFRNRVNDSSLLALGAGAFIVAGALDIQSFFTGVYLSENILMYGFGTFLISMSVFIARDFARTESESNRRAVALEEATKRAALAAELERVNHELRQTQAVLVQSEKMAALGQLAAGLSHEMNTPLGAIQSGRQTMERSIEKLRGSATDSDALSTRVFRILDDSAQVVGDGASRIATIVRKLKNFARLDESARQRVSVRAIVDDTLGMLESTWPENIRRSVDVDDGLELDGYPGELNQMLYQVVQNALQAQPDGGEVNLRAKREGDIIHIHIEDRGPGVQPSLRDRIFDPGFTTRGVGVGVGLGLSIAYRIAERHGGRIDVADRTPNGATFAITLKAG
ncbi:MAG: sensor histidine kinase [Myxococcota bacterium]